MNLLGLDYKAGALALVITSLALYLLQPFAAKLNLLDHPKGRKDHANPTPVSYTHLDVYKRQAIAGAGTLV